MAPNIHEILAANQLPAAVAGVDQAIESALGARSWPLRIRPLSLWPDRGRLKPLSATPGAIRPCSPLFSRGGLGRVARAPEADRGFFPASDLYAAKWFLATHRHRNLFFGVTARQDDSGGNLGIRRRPDLDRRGRP
jgi:hypothetical protein